MKLFITILLFGLTFVTKAEAKTFHKRQATVALTYSNVITGTETVIQMRPVEIRFSNNDDNCLVFKNGQISEQQTSGCTIEYDYYAGDSAFEISIPSIEFWTNDLVSSRLLPSWTRIIRHYKSLDFTASRTAPYVYKAQLHDSVATESFHITISVDPESQI
jgi:hypothetical protein